MCLLILVIPNGPLIIEREKPTWQKICSTLIKYVPKQKPNTRPISSCGGGLGLSPQLWKSSGRLGFVPLYSSSQQPSKPGSYFGWFCFKQTTAQKFPNQTQKFSNRTQKLSNQATSQNLSIQQAATQNSTSDIDGTGSQLNNCVWWGSSYWLLDKITSVHTIHHSLYYAQRCFISVIIWHPLQTFQDKQNSLLMTYLCLSWGVSGKACQLMLSEFEFPKPFGVPFPF